MGEWLLWKPELLLSVCGGGGVTQALQTCPLDLLNPSPAGSYRSLWSAVNLSSVRHRILSTSERVRTLFKEVLWMSAVTQLTDDPAGTKTPAFAEGVACSIGADPRSDQILDQQTSAPI